MNQKIIQQEYNVLQKEHKQTEIALADARAEHDKLREKYTLVSNLLTVTKSSENKALEEFKKLFEVEFTDFANKESSLAEEAEAVQKLQSVEKRLEDVVAFPHTFMKKSIAIGGGFSSGKSEFVNSFITGSNIKMHVDFKPATAIPSFVISSSEVSIKGLSYNGGTVDIDPKFYRQLSHSFIDTLSFNLKEIMPCVRVEVPLVEGLFENIYLIDTPGYDPALKNEDRSTAADILKYRDALIWMIGLDATGTVPASDLAFINGLELDGAVPFYVVLNKADLKPETELQDILYDVLDTLEAEEIEPMGISAYSATQGEEYLSEGMDLHEFFRSQNQPVDNIEVELQKEIEGVFEMYEKAIAEDEENAEMLRQELQKLSLDISSELKKSKLDPDEMDDLIKKIDAIKKSQDKDFAPIKDQMNQIEKKMHKAVDEIFWSLKPQKQRQELAEEEAKFVAEVGRDPSPSGVNDKGKTDLHIAADLNLDMLTQSLLKQGADVHAKNNDGSTPLHDAAIKNAYATAELLLKRGVDVHEKNKYGWTPLHDAAKNNARETAELLLKHGADVNEKNYYGWTPLDVAARYNACVTAELLLKHGANVNPKNDDGDTPLHATAYNNACATAELLLKHGADVNEKNNEDRTPLDVAEKYSARETEELLLKHGADVNEKNNEDRTPLDVAEKYSARKTKELLLKHGADVNEKNRIGDTPLHDAAKNNAPETEELLLKRRIAEILRLAAEEAKFVAKVGRKPSASRVNKGETDLHFAVALNLDMIARSLLKQGADVHAQDNYGNTPLHVAAKNDARETAELLLNQGADVRAKAKNGWTPLHDAAYNNAPETAEVLLKQGADIHAKNKNRWTPLDSAAYKNAHEIVEMLRRYGTETTESARLAAEEAEKARQEKVFVGKVGRKPSPIEVNHKGETDLHFAASLNLDMIALSLLKQGADVNAKTTYGRTPLHDAAKNNARETAELLLYGADVNAKNRYGETPLHNAARYNAREIAEMLLNHGANVHAKNNYGSTPLHWATSIDAREIAEMLLKQGADVNPKDNNDSTPLQDAAKNNARETAELLLKQGADVNAENINGRMPLHWAASIDAREIAEMLLNHGADVHAKNSDGWTPLHVAAMSGAHATAEVLRRYGR